MPCIHGIDCKHLRHNTTLEKILIAPAGKKLLCAAHNKLRNVANAIVFESGCCNQCVAWLRDWHWNIRPDLHALNIAGKTLQISWTQLMHLPCSSIANAVYGTSRHAHAHTHTHINCAIRCIIDHDANMICFGASAMRLEELSRGEYHSSVGCGCILTVTVSQCFSHEPKTPSAATDAKSSRWCTPASISDSGVCGPIQGTPRKPMRFEA